MRSLIISSFALWLASQGAQAAILSHYSDQGVNLLGERQLELTADEAGKSRLDLKVPVAAFDDASWMAEGQLVVDWSHCQSEEFLSKSGELSQCLRQATLAVDGEFDRLQPGRLQVNLLQSGDLQATYFDGRSVVLESFVIKDPKGLLSSIKSSANLGASSIKKTPHFADTTNFAFLGDTGRGSRAQYAVGSQLKSYCDQEDCQFSLLLGDNIYNNGVSSVNDAKFQSHFEMPYASVDFPFYVVLGNHDHRGDTRAQVTYSQKSQKWVMPARYYHFRQGVADFYAIDSDAFDANQRQWLVQKLETSTAPWKVVFAHHPVYSYGSHGNTTSLVRTLKPLLEQYGVQLFINGHDHDKQHIEVNGVHYLTSGVGASARGSRQGPLSKYASSRLGFGHLSMTNSEAVLKFVDQTGAVEYQAKIPR